MWGSDIGYLTVLKRYDYTAQGLVPLSQGSLQGDHGNDWNLGTYPLDNQKGDTRNFKVKYLTPDFKLA